MRNNIKSSSPVVEISETANYIELTNRLCYYDYPNGNGKILSSVDADEKAKTLVNQPVVAKYVEKNNLPNFGGHEMKKDTKGNVTFGTDYIGTHTEVYTKDDEVELFSGEIVTAKCLYAKSRIWKRKPNVIKAIRRLYNMGKLFTSWELVFLDITDNDDGTTTINDYYFESNCILGTANSPAYGKCATTLEVASQEENPELLMAEALAVDINNEKSVKEDTMAKSKENEIVTEENIEQSTTEEIETPVAEKIEEAKCGDKKEKDKAEPEVKENKDESEKETASLTSRDIRKKVEKACREKVRWCWISFIFPEEHYALVEEEERESELEFLKFTYTVENDDVTVGEPERVKLAVSVANINSEIVTKNETIISANEKIQKLEAEVSELTKFKEQVAEIEKEKAEKEIAEKRDNLKQYALNSKQITSEEVEQDENISRMISELNEVGIKSIIADRIVASLSVETNKKVEVSEVQEKSAKAEIDVDDEIFDAKSIIKNFLRK